MFRTHVVPVALIGLLSLAPVPAFAQATAGPTDGVGERAHHPIALALEHAEHLSLTPEQHARLTASLERWIERTGEARVIVREQMAEAREGDVATDRDALRERMMQMDRERMRSREVNPAERQQMRERMRADPAARRERLEAMDREELIERMMRMDRERMRGARDRMSPELRARATLTRAHREGMQELRDVLTGHQVRELRLLAAVSVAPRARRR